MIWANVRLVEISILVVIGINDIITDLCFRKTKPKKSYDHSNCYRVYSYTYYTYIVG